MSFIDSPYPVNLRSELESSTGFNMDSHDQSPGFFASPGTIAASASLLVKRYANEREDTIHILRLNKGPKGSRFRFPSLFASTVSKRLFDVLEQMEQVGDSNWKLPGLETTSTYEDLSEDQFWMDKYAIKVVMFHVRPYITSYNKLMFRMWNAVDPANQKVYENDKGKVLWKGPVASLTVDETRGLATALLQLTKTAAERE